MRGILLLAIVVLTLVVEQSSLCDAAPIDCKLFDPKKIRLITFDVFAALMDTYESMLVSVTRICPFLSAAQVKQMTMGMLMMYSDYADHVFTPAETKGVEPFLWVTNASLGKLAAQLRIQNRLYPGNAVWNALLACWGDLTPYPETKETLQKISKAGYLIGPLSNGAVTTLRNATRVFLPVKMYDIFSSDWPVGAFKPQPAMYAQLLHKHNFTAMQVLHVGGAEIDAQGARQFGLFSALNLADQPIPGIQPCFYLQNITSLLPILGLK